MPRSRSLLRLAALSAAALLLAGGDASAQTRLLRFPDIHGDKVVFTYAGDLWTAPASGGAARRLTAHPGVEVFGRFSPDGRMIAFTGQYDGDEQVYVIPAGGGIPQQLTFYPAAGPLADRWGFDNQVYDWTPDGRGVVFRSMRYGFDLSDTRLFSVPLDGGLPVPYPMPVSGAADLSPDGTKAVYSPLVRDFRTWKRYEGGWAQELWIFDMETYDVRRVTDHPRSDRDPMWIGNAIYFNSDRDGTMNLYSFDVASGDVQQLTRSRTWDVRWPSDDGEGRIVYELNGQLHVLEIAAKTTKPLSILVPDDGLWMRPERMKVAGHIEDWALSPEGRRAVFSARGDIFTAPVEKGPTRNLTRSSGAHDRAASWSPDGKQIAFISDESGEEEIYVVPQDGSEEPRALTRGSKGRLYPPEWSPDGERLAYSDKEGRIHVLKVDSGSKQTVADEKDGQVTDYAWSPRGGHLAFSLSDDNGFDSIHIWTAGGGRTRRITGAMFHEFGPAWDPEGSYLYYMADRMYQPQISSIEWNYATDRETYIYALALREDVEHPFPPESDEVEIDSGEEKQEEGGKSGEPEREKEDEDGSGEPIRIDFEGLDRRVARVPVEADNYGGLSAIKGHLLYFRSGPFYYGRSSDIQPSLRVFDLDKREESALAEEIGGYALSHDGSKVLVRHGSSYKIYDAGPKGKDSAKAVSTAGLEADVVPAEEWAQIFDEVWRRYRDFFYVENMHGYDWEALGRRYRSLLEHVAHRSDLNYVIGEMIAELSVGHTYVWGGDIEAPDRPKSALPGANFELDAASGRYRIARIFRGQNEEPEYRAPLTEIGVDAREGDYLLAIDGEEIRAGDNPYEHLVHRAGRPVTFTLNSSPSMDGAREITYSPVTDEDNLRYLDWVETNRRKVDEMTGGRVGYLHLPNMGSSGIREFIKWFYPQVRKEGLVVDVRNNGGGNVSQMLIERLDRELLGTRFSRTYERPGTYPATVFHGHMACILDEDSASDGDIFPARFRAAGLGPLIGKRSWGGVIGITSHGPLIDGGQIRVPQFGTNDVDGSWIIEGRGVEPDIEVDNDPKSVIEGKDPQLERAVAEIMKKIREEPRSLPHRPAPPVKTKEAGAGD